MAISRRQTNQVHVGSVAIGGGAPIAVQSMCSTDTHDVDTTLAQIERLVQADCEIVRVAVPHASALDAFEEICKRSPIPVVADIHFDHKLAIEAARRGAAKLRINPGNIGSMDKVDQIIDAAQEAGIPIRIGVNAGSLDKAFEERSDLSLAEKLVESACSFIDHFESRGFHDLVISTKASDATSTVEAYRLLSERTNHPLHLGVTEAGTLMAGTIKSSVGLGVLLEEGIGDTIRVSLTADPVEEPPVAWAILAALDIRRNAPEIISCPTCGRCQVDMIPIANEVTERLKGVKRPIKVAVMGCVVNGPGEARDADLGVAHGKGSGIIFAKGETVRKVSEDEIVEALFEEIDKLG